jgi:hypothetical protein
MGDLVVIDHKFPYNFWTTKDTDLNPQIPKYIAALQTLGMPVKRGLINQLRYRELKSPQFHDIFQRLPVRPDVPELLSSVDDQINISARIVTRSKLSLEMQDRLAIRVRSKIICDKCPFNELCVAEYKGTDPRGIQELMYEENEYGYGDYEYDEPEAA